MPRKARVEFPGAVYHLLDRGDRQEALLRDDGDGHESAEILRLTPFAFPLSSSGGAFDSSTVAPVFERAQTEGFGFDVELLYLAWREAPNEGDSGALESPRRKQGRLLPRQPTHAGRSREVIALRSRGRDFHHSKK